jgi:hypothetical protein
VGVLICEYLLTLPTVFSIRAALAVHALVKVVIGVSISNSGLIGLSCACKNKVPAEAPGASLDPKSGVHQSSVPK